MDAVGERAGEFAERQCEAEPLGVAGAACCCCAARRNAPTRRIQPVLLVAAASRGSGGAVGVRAALAFWMLNHCGQYGARPPPPREHFEKPNGRPSLKAK